MGRTPKVGKLYSPNARCVFLLTFHFLGVIGIGLLITLLFIGRAAACSCMETHRFASRGGIIPSNSRGILWQSRFELTVQTRSAPVQIFDRARESVAVEVERFFPTERRRTKHGFDQTPRHNSFAAMANLFNVWLVRPRAGFKKGASYVFRHTESDPQEIIVTVSHSPFIAPAGALPLKTDRQIIGEVGIAAGASCSKSITAAQLPITMELPQSLEPFRDHLYFETFTDGNDPWLVSPSLCDPGMPGASWRGKGVDLLFRVCGNVSNEIVTEGITSGRHTVKMRATLPGTELQAVTNEVAFELKCATQLKPKR